MDNKATENAGEKKTTGATSGFKIAIEEGYYFFLCLIILSFFFLLCVAILCFFLFLPQGTAELLISLKMGRFCNYGVYYRDFACKRSIAGEYVFQKNAFDFG
jgi:hypothetical protein